MAILQHMLIKMFLKDLNVARVSTSDFSYSFIRLM